MFAEHESYRFPSLENVFISPLLSFLMWVGFFFCCLFFFMLNDFRLYPGHFEYCVTIIWVLFKFFGYCWYFSVRSALVRFSPKIQSAFCGLWVPRLFCLCCSSDRRTFPTCVPPSGQSSKSALICTSGWAQFSHEEVSGRLPRLLPLRELPWVLLFPRAALLTSGQRAGAPCALPHTSCVLNQLMERREKRAVWVCLPLLGSWLL